MGPEKCTIMYTRWPSTDMRGLRVVEVIPKVVETFLALHAGWDYVVVVLEWGLPRDQKNNGPKDCGYLGEPPSESG